MEQKKGLEIVREIGAKIDRDRAETNLIHNSLT